MLVAGKVLLLKNTFGAMYDALRTLESVIDQPGTVLGGGSFHIAAALHLRERGRIRLWTSTPSHRRICPSAGTIPSTLALNAGEDQIDLCSNCVLHIETSPIVLVFARTGVLEKSRSSALLLDRFHALQAAVETLVASSS